MNYFPSEGGNDKVFVPEACPAGYCEDGRERPRLLTAALVACVKFLSFWPISLLGQPLQHLSPHGIVQDPLAHQLANQFVQDALALRARAHRRFPLSPLPHPLGTLRQAPPAISSDSPVVAGQSTRTATPCPSPPRHRPPWHWLSNDRFSLLMRTLTTVPAGKGLIVSA